MRDINNLRELTEKDFIEAYSELYYKKIRDFIISNNIKSSDLVPYEGIKGKEGRSYQVCNFLRKEIEAGDDSEVIEGDSENNSERVIKEFIKANLELSLETIFYYERQLGNRSPELTLDLIHFILDITATRITLAIGAETISEENIVRKGREIISFYEERIKDLAKLLPKCSPGGGLVMEGNFIQSKLSPKGKSLVDIPGRIKNVYM